MSLKKRLENYKKSNMYPFHMPGHKRMLDGCYQIDMTEVEGVDDLHDPEDVIALDENRLATLYGVDKAFMLVGGSTVGNLSAIYACLMENDYVLIQRNSHKSVYNGATIRHLKVGYINPKLDENGIYKAATLEEIKESVVAAKTKPKAIVITSPTYEGYYCNIEKIAEYCRSENIILIVDEAHGAHLGFHESFPHQAAGKADVVITSLHKTLPCLTQTAALLISTNRVDITGFREALDIFETSSPSYVLMNSISQCIDVMEDNRDYYDKYVDNLNDFYKIRGKLKHLEVISEEADKKDIGKLVISTKHTNLSGVELAKILREKYEIETELSSFSYVLAMTSFMDTKEGFERLKKALLEIDKAITVGEIKVPILYAVTPNKRMELWEAKTSAVIEIPLEESHGRISSTMVCLYPPGAPVIVPGEEISNQSIEIINNALKTGIHVTGLNKGRICVVN
ncbi:MAG: aminotransferase class I/II-fold pyridoxal phosphate-dependent enzyme [Pseudobutyrivibrio sp.]|nr:aminotransferase class I/II-fold pyridoxal phosphate-dependent enzyme [Pseudobutyrivibrio sp.]